MNMTEQKEQMIYEEGYKRGYEDGRKAIKTKEVKYFDSTEGVWTIGEVIIAEQQTDCTTCDHYATEDCDNGCVGYEKAFPQAEGSE